MNPRVRAVVPKQDYRLEITFSNWPHAQDVCPDTLYEESRKVAPT